eukprot:scpid16303/ scgid5130/ Transmembrane channel-like protein 7
MSSPLVSDWNGRPTRNASRSKVPSPTGATHGRHSRRQPSRSTNSNGRSTITAGAAAHDGDTAASRWAVRGGQQRTGTPAQDRVSSAEVRRRLRALQYGDIEGVELDTLPSGGAVQPSNEAATHGDTHTSAQQPLTAGPRVLTGLSASRVPPAVNRAVDDAGLDADVGKADWTSARATGNVLGARLRVHNNTEQEAAGTMAGQGGTPMVRFDTSAADLGRREQSHSDTGRQQMANVAGAMKTVGKAAGRMMQSFRPGYNRLNEEDGGRASKEVTWTSHPAQGTVHASKDQSQRINLVRSRAKQVNSPDGYAHHLQQETVRLPAGAQAWRESSLLEQRHIDLQLLHITSNGPAEDMTERLESQPDVKTGILRKAENERAGKSKFQLVLHSMKVFYSSFRRTSESNPFLKEYITTIQARYGNGTAAFFIFVRSILQLNILLSLLWLGFVIIPTLVHKDFAAETDPSQELFLLRHMFDGKGPVQTSILFYGGYRVPTRSHDYKLDMAYLMITMATVYGSFFVVVHWLSVALTSDKRAVQRPDASAGSSYATTVLSSWEHSSTRSVKAVRNMQAGISTTLKELLDERKRKQKAKKLTKNERYRIYALRLLAWSIAIIITGGALTGLIFLSQATSVKSSQPPSLNNNTMNGTGNARNITGQSPQQETDEQKSASADQIREFGFALSFVAINSIVPAIMEKLVLFEYYPTERIETMVTLVRVFAVRMFNIYVLVYSLNTRITQAENDSLGCGGTYFGQELYKVLVIESLLQPTVKIAMHYLYFYWNKTRWKMNRPQALLGVVYMEALIWTGTPFCPLLPVLGSISMSLIFLAYYRIVMDTCNPPEKRWTQSRHDPVFIFMLALSSLVVMAPASLYLTGQQARMGYITSSSRVCGPYNSSVPLDTFERTISISETKPGLAFTIVNWTFSKTVLVPLAAIVIAVCHFMHMRSKQLSRQRDCMGDDWAMEHYHMRTYLSFISSCTCRAKERDKILKGTAGEFFDDVNHPPRPDPGARATTAAAAAGGGPSSPVPLSAAGNALTASNGEAGNSSTSAAIRTLPTLAITSPASLEASRGVSPPPPMAASAASLASPKSATSRPPPLRRIGEISTVLSRTDMLTSAELNNTQGVNADTTAGYVGNTEDDAV